MATHFWPGNGKEREEGDVATVHGSIMLHIASGYDYITVRHGFSMAHRNRWFTVLKNGGSVHGDVE